MNKRQYITELVAKMTDKQTADMIIDLLQDEGVLSLGYGNEDVDRVIGEFTKEFGTTKVTQSDRRAAHRLSQKHGSQAIVGIIRLLSEHRDEKYCPTVGSVTQLEDKLVSVLHFLRHLNKGTEEIQT